MPDTPQCRTDVLSERQPPAYRVVLLAKSGTVINAWRLIADGDEQAMECAKGLVDGHAVELWDGVRFIEHFPPID